MHSRQYRHVPSDDAWDGTPSRGRSVVISASVSSVTVLPSNTMSMKKSGCSRLRFLLRFSMSMSSRCRRHTPEIWAQVAGFNTCCEGHTYTWRQQQNQRTWSSVTNDVWKDTNQSKSRPGMFSHWMSTSPHTTQFFNWTAQKHKTYMAPHDTNGDATYLEHDAALALHILRRVWVVPDGVVHNFAIPMLPRCGAHLKKGQGTSVSSVTWAYTRAAYRDHRLHDPRKDGDIAHD